MCFAVPYKKYHCRSYTYVIFYSADKSVLHVECPSSLSRGDECRENIEDIFHSDPVGKIKEIIFPDYTSYMTGLIFSGYASPLTSPCHSSTQSSPADKKQVRYNMYFNDILTDIVFIILI